MSKRKKETEEIAPGLYKLDSNQKKQAVTKITYYTSYGQQDILNDGIPILLDKNLKKEFAFKKTVGDESTFFIRVDNDNYLFDVNQNKNQVLTDKQRLLKSNPEFTKVNQICFNHYLEFLKTLNPLHLKLAEQNRI